VGKNRLLTLHNVGFADKNSQLAEKIALFAEFFWNSAIELLLLQHRNESMQVGIKKSTQ